MLSVNLIFPKINRIQWHWNWLMFSAWNKYAGTSMLHNSNRHSCLQKPIQNAHIFHIVAPYKRRKKCNPINNNNNKNAYAVWHWALQNCRVYVLSTWTKGTLISWLKTIEISTPYGFGEWERRNCVTNLYDRHASPHSDAFLKCSKTFISISIFSNRLSCGIHNLVNLSSALQFEMDEMMHQSRSSAPGKFRQRNRVWICWRIHRKCI